MLCKFQKRKTMVKLLHHQAATLNHTAWCPLTERLFEHSVSGDVTLFTGFIKMFLFLFFYIY